MHFLKINLIVDRKFSYKRRSYNFSNRRRKRKFNFILFLNCIGACVLTSSLLFSTRKSIATTKGHYFRGSEECLKGESKYIQSVSV